MIAFLRGKPVVAEGESLVIDVAGVGYRVHVGAALLARLPQGETETLIHTYLVVREDSMQLYGFLSAQEITAFTLLLGVNGVGPKLAMAILSHLSMGGLCRAMVMGDTLTLTKVPGVGKKTAQRLVLELKDKFGRLDVGLEHGVQQQDLNESTSALEDALEALLALGYGDNEARGAVQRVAELDLGDTGKIIQAALRYLDQSKG